MAQTKQGAILIAAIKAGVSLDEYLRLSTQGLKRCTKCKTWKDKVGFGKDRARHDGLDAKCFECRRVKVRVSTKGRISTFKGRTHSPEARLRMSESAKSHPSNRLGKPHSTETKVKISRITIERTPRGENHYAYSHGQHQRNLCERRSVEYQRWRTAVFTRDAFTCQHCGDDRGGNLQAHHLKGFADFPELRYEVANGITLCQDCHEKVHLKPIPRAKCRRKKHAMPT